MCFYKFCNVINQIFQFVFKAQMRLLWEIAKIPCISADFAANL